MAFLFRKGGLDFFLLCKVVIAELAEHLIGDFAKDIILIKPLEQGCQFGIPPLEVFQFPLRLSNIPTDFSAALLRNVFSKQEFMLPCIMGHPAQVVERQIIALTNCITRSKYSYKIKIT